MTPSLSAVPPHGSSSPGDAAPEYLLQVRHLTMHFPIKKGFLQRTAGHVYAVDDVSFVVQRGTIFGLVGESGCGKSTTGRCIVRLLKATAGEIIFQAPGAAPVHMEALSHDALRAMRRHMQIVFQDPYASLNPRLTLKQIVSEPLVINRICQGQELQDRVAALLRDVGLSPEYMNRYPHAFSGGQRQRISLARALALHPEFIVADEPVSALDVSVQAQILNLIKELQETFDLTYLFIAHNMSVIKHVCDEVAVMYVGQIVEMATTQALFTHPLHPYTEALLMAIPAPDPRRRAQRIVLEGDVPNPANPPPGCHFHSRCAYVQDVCVAEAPPLQEHSPGHFARCHFAMELTLQGIPA